MKFDFRGFDYDWLLSKAETQPPRHFAKKLVIEVLEMTRIDLPQQKFCGFDRLKHCVILNSFQNPKTKEMPKRVYR